MKQAHIIVFGFVQGVGYRKFVRNAGRQLGLVGWVKNIPDGKVEAVIQGEENRITKLIAICKKGPMLAQVENIEVAWEETKEVFEEFVVKHE